jgi:hypothetical protein
MALKDTLTTTTTALDQAQIPHALIGGFALAVYKVVRATVDLDFLVHGDKRAQAIAVMTAVGFQLVFESPEVAQFSGPGQVDFLFANRPAAQNMLKEAHASPDLHVRVAQAEAIIGLKIQAYKNDPSREYQDKADILALIQKNPGLDFSKVKFYADIFSEWSTIETMRSLK